MFDVTHLIQTGGLLLIALIIFAESGMMVGLFFPGDTLLFSAGILAATGQFEIASVLVTIAIAAVIGDNTGYQIGKSLGPKLFTKKDGLVFRKEYIEKAHVFFDKYGNRTLLLAHFIPLIRSFAPVVAGAANLPRKQFILYDTIGAVAWTFLVTLLGFFLGKRFPSIENYVEPVLIIIVLIFVLPTLYHVLRDPQVRARLRSKFSRKSKN